MVKIKRYAGRSNEVQNESSFIDPTSRSLIYDEVDDFIDNNEDEDNDFYASSSRIITDNTDKEQVLGLEGDTSSDDSDDDEDEDDEDDGDEDDGSDKELFENDIVSDAESYTGEDDRFLGRQKKDFYGTDVPDQKIHNVAKRRIKTKNVREIVEAQREGAKQLQERMMSEIAGLPSFSQFLPEVDDTVVDILPKKLKEVELSGKSAAKAKTKKELKKLYREFKPIFSQINEITDELEDYLCPLIEAKKSGLITVTSAVEYLQTRYFLSINYLNLLTAYLMVRCSGSDMTNHPAETRLAQCKHLFQELEPCKVMYDPELQSLLAEIQSGRLKKSKKKKLERKMLGVVQSKDKTSKPLPGSKATPTDLENDEMEVEEQNSDSEIDEQGEIEDQNLGEDERRLITVEIKKNKGLMPTRKKDQKNPRVRYKNKYKHKLSRRKGQVRAVRRELDRYSGEVTGIKADLIKSVKFK